MIKLTILTFSFSLILLSPDSFAAPIDDYIARKQAHAAYLRQNAESNIKYSRAHSDSSNLQSSMTKNFADLEPASGSGPVLPKIELKPQNTDQTTSLKSSK